MPEWLMGADCKSAGNAYAGSNPARPKHFLLTDCSQPNTRKFLGEVSEWFMVTVLKTVVA